MRGKVRWFSDKRGYGFIKSKKIDKDIFVHFSQIQEEGYKTLEEGQEVEFEVFMSDRGLQAKNVVKCSQ